jgi:peroxiredoxin
MFIMSNQLASNYKFSENSITAIPGHTFPSIKLKNAEGKTIDLADRNDDRWKLIIVYRGIHCPLCSKYLQTLESLYPEFTKNGIDIMAISADSIEELSTQINDDKLSFPMACQLSADQMRMLGLFISEPLASENSNNLFSEPGLFIINSNGDLHIIERSNAPYLRPDLTTLPSTLSYIKQSGDKRHDNFGGDYYPIRGAI